MTRPQMLAVMGIAAVLLTMLYLIAFCYIIGGLPNRVDEKVCIMLLWFIVVPSPSVAVVSIVQWAIKDAN